MVFTLYWSFALQTFTSLGLFTWIVYVHTYCVLIATLNLKKRSRLLYLGDAQMIRHHTGDDGKKQNVRVLSFTPSTSHRSARAFFPFSRNQKQGLFERETQALIQSQFKTGNQVFTSAGDINNHFTNVGQSLAQEIPSSEIDPLMPMLILLTEYFLFNGLMFKKSSNYLRLSM